MLFKTIILSLLLFNLKNDCLGDRNNSSDKKKSDNIQPAICGVPPYGGKKEFLPDAQLFSNNLLKIEDSELFDIFVPLINLQRRTILGDFCERILGIYDKENYFQNCLDKLFPIKSEEEETEKDKKIYLPLLFRA